MAIEFNCPHCAHAYRLKDELAGKTATCKTCRNKIVIPQPVTVPDDKPARLTAEEMAAKEAEALAALADEQAKVEEDAAARLIPIECPHCNHKWTEALERAGKNTLCPNPECRQRIKIPEPKEDQTQNWRVKNSKLPSMAKGANEKLEGVQDAEDAKMVSGKSLVEAGAIEEDLEPRSLKRMAMFGAVILFLIGGVVFGAVSLLKSRTGKNEDKLIAESQDEFAKSLGALPPSEAPQEVSLCAAILFIAGGEHAVRHDDDKNKLKDALKQFSDARDAIRKAPAGHARNAVAGELAVALLVLGGTEQQARDQVRIRWVPDSKLKTRPNERVHTMLEELRQTLGIVQGADFEFKNHLARRLTRELVKREQAAHAVELILVALFAPTEQDEAKALIALEVLRADKNSDQPRQVAEDLKTRGPELVKGVPTPASAQTLFIALGDDKTRVVQPPAPSGTLSDGTRLAHVGKFLLDNQPGDALKLAQRPGNAEGQVRALVLCADWSTDSSAALDAAYGLIFSRKDKKEVSPYSILRLAQIAAEKGKHDQAKEFAKLIPDDGLKAWAQGSGVQARIAGAPKDKAEEAWVELPGNLPKEFRAGHAWGLLWIARQNTKLSKNRSAEVKTVSAWAPAAVPFGKAGVALGLQDK